MKNVWTALTEERIFMKKTKIVCTLGPATDDDNVLRELIKSGMDCARFNFSHGTHEDHKKRYEQVERIRKELRLPIPAILDTKGPEVRIKSFKDDKPVELKTGSEYTLTTEDVIGDEKRAAINYPNLASDIETGVTILIDDGLLELKVTEIDRKESGDDIRCKVIHGGMLKPNKSCNFPGIHLSMPYLSERDKSDLLFGIKTGFDIVAASFVTRDEDIIQIRKLLDENGGKDISIIAKIENQDGVDNIDDILRVADGIMVARGRRTDRDTRPCKAVFVAQRGVLYPACIRKYYPLFDTGTWQQPACRFCRSIRDDSKRRCGTGTCTRFRICRRMSCQPCGMGACRSVPLPCVLPLCEDT